MKSQAVLEFIKNHPLFSSMEIHTHFSNEMSYATTKRILKSLAEENLIDTEGKGKGTKYVLSKCYELIHPIDVDLYFEKEIDDRTIKSEFNHTLFQDVFQSCELFTSSEIEYLEILQKQFTENISSISKLEFERELERLAIDLSWKSSQIEGNTYSLLETELLLKEKQTAHGKTKDEATMLLNHKDALDFIIQNKEFIEPLKLSSIEDIHSILMKELGVERNIRKRRVGISGTNYVPLDNEFQLKEALENMCEIVNTQKDVFSKALLVLVLISYIQPFGDGNKRTARIISNALLMNNNYCPISFRTVDSIDYKKAMLIFYEQNNIVPFKKIFISQFEFAVKTYF